MKVTYSGWELFFLCFIFATYLPAWFTAAPIWSAWIYKKLTGRDYK